MRSARRVSAGGGGLWWWCCWRWFVMSSAALGRGVVALSRLQVVRTCVAHTALSPAPASQVSAPLGFSLGAARTLSSATSLVHVSEEPDVLYKRLIVRVKAHERPLLDSYEFFITRTAQFLNIPIHSVYEPRRKIERLTVLKSVHIYKKHRVQYEMRTHFRVIELKYLTGSTANVYLEYIQRNLPEGVAMEVTRHTIEQIPEHIANPEWKKEAQQEGAKPELPS
uniref:Small ribosomal subunit protein uS10m n=1 Tax=Petromyzon marinus TaxID=7757 RepID=A0AAJ7TNC0_PETMA|nr:28S ribosomal protein S10, mitochondrial isoform X2 [Petromyzon marinus]